MRTATALVPPLMTHGVDTDTNLGPILEFPPSSHGTIHTFCECVFLQVTASALVAAAERWPRVFRGMAPAQEREIRQWMRRVRPVLVR